MSVLNKTSRDERMASKNLKLKGEIQKYWMIKLFLISIVVFIAFLSSFYLRGFFQKSPNKLKYWSVTLENFGEYAPSLRSHNRVFKRLNYEFVNASKGDDWDILWALESPFDDVGNHSLFCGIQNKKLLPHQKINHFEDPWMSALISKSLMNRINRKYDFILKAFYLPKEQELFDEFLKENPEKKVLEKNFFNRGVKIIDVKNLKPKEEHFYQEFMDSPFLIDGHAFDFGVFVLITSFDPLRVYRYSDEVLLRFCTEKYHPFDAGNRDKYVVKDGSLHVTEMPYFRDLYKNFKYSSKLMFENLIKTQGFDIKKFWERIDKAIGTIVHNTEKSMTKYPKNLTHSRHHFFELVRFDIILDAKLNPYVVEVNMSPNLTPAEEKHEENSLIYEQLIYNVVKMIGGGSRHEFMSRFDPTDTIVKNPKNLATSLNECLNNDCQNNCNKTICAICQPCMTSEILYQLSEAFRENQNSANFRRVFPSKNHFANEKLIEKMTKNNQIQLKWYEGKCNEDKRWC